MTDESADMMIRFRGIAGNKIQVLVHFDFELEFRIAFPDAVVSYEYWPDDNTIFIRNIKYEIESSAGNIRALEVFTSKMSEPYAMLSALEETTSQIEPVTPDMLLINYDDDADNAQIENVMIGVTVRVKPWRSHGTLSRVQVCLPAVIHCFLSSTVGLHVLLDRLKRAGALTVGTIVDYNIMNAGTKRNRKLFGRMDICNLAGSGGSPSLQVIKAVIFEMLTDYYGNVTPPQASYGYHLRFDHLLRIGAVSRQGIESQNGAIRDRLFGHDLGL